MATKAKETKENEKDAAQENQDGPLLDLSDAAVKKMLKAAKKRGYVTYEELNEVLPSDQVSSEQIEDILALLNEMGINVIENEEAEEAESDGDNEGESEGGALAEVKTGGALEKKKSSEPADRTDDPV
ncbi:MAG: RNA polymerase sigma factor RpoD, partial [Rhodobiaceae bacterium]|nr:RNA polymerase sigma factor RpoD [Rhodobiaceae bacterium]